MYTVCSDYVARALHATTPCRAPPPGAGRARAAIDLRTGVAMSGQHDRFALTGRRALITGASSGLGQHFAAVLAEAGATVVIAARRKDRLDALSAELAEQGYSVHGLTLATHAVALTAPECNAFVATAVTMDVTSIDSIVRGFDEAENALGGQPVDILVNNAGIASPNLALRIKPDEWDALMNTNLRERSSWLSRQQLSLIDANCGGAIVNVSSILGQRTGTQQSSYGAAKAGLDQLTRVLAMELARIEYELMGSL